MTDQQAPTAPVRRNRNLIHAVLSSALGRGSTMIAPLLIIPASFRYMGAERYGLWMAITSLTSMALFADFGIGNGLLTKLAHSEANNDREESARIVSSAYVILGTISAGLFASVGLMAWTVDWAAFFKISDLTVATDARFIAFACFGAFAVNIPLSLVQRVQYAQQQVTQSNIWQAGGSAATVIAVFVGTGAGISPAALAAVIVAAPCLVNAANTWFFFTFQQRRLRPSFERSSRAAAKSIGGMGLRFFFISVLTSASMNGDTFLASKLVDTATAGHYAVTVRVFTTLNLFVTIVALALWPATAAALAQGDVVWVKKITAKASMLSGAAVLVGGTLLITLFDPVVSVWLGSNEASFATPGMLIGLLAWSVALASMSPFFTVQNSAGVLRPQLVGWCLFLPASLVAKGVLAHRYGVAGIPLAGFALYALIMAPSAILGYRKSLQTAAAAARKRQPRNRDSAVAPIEAPA